jgi:hypothetical protein
MIILTEGRKDILYSIATLWMYCVYCVVIRELPRLIHVQIDMKMEHAGCYSVHFSMCLPTPYQTVNKSSLRDQLHQCYESMHEFYHQSQNTSQLAVCSDNANPL